ncbi:hypothetical protein B566_EDAN004674 [Ephemera danica]|nr:hypothetical protein B566_EDAN004674 [Ephemera danica]
MKHLKKTDITWDELGEVAIRNNVLKGSSIKDLLLDVVGKTNTNIDPIGWKDFYTELYRTNLSIDFISLAQRKKIISSLDVLPKTSRKPKRIDLNFISEAQRSRLLVLRRQCGVCLQRAGFREGTRSVLLLPYKCIVRKAFTEHRVFRWLLQPAMAGIHGTYSGLCFTRRCAGSRASALCVVKRAPLSALCPLTVLGWSRLELERREKDVDSSSCT